jgi:hypothetical protein
MWRVEDALTGMALCYADNDLPMNHVVLDKFGLVRSSRDLSISGDLLSRMDTSPASPTRDRMAML